MNCIDTRFQLCIELILVILHRLTDDMHSIKQQLIVICIQALKSENSPQYLLLDLLHFLMKSTTCSDAVINDISEIPVFLSHSEDRRVFWSLCKIQTQCCHQVLHDQFTFLVSISQFLPFLSNSDLMVRQIASRSLGRCLFDSLIDESLFHNLLSKLFTFMETESVVIFDSCGQAFLEAYYLDPQRFSKEHLLWIVQGFLELAQRKPLSREVLFHFLSCGVIVRANCNIPLFLLQEVMRTLADRSIDIALGCETLVVLLKGCGEIPSDMRREMERVLFSFMMDPQIEIPLLVCSVLTILKSDGEDVVGTIKTMTCSLGRQLYLMGAVSGQDNEKRAMLTNVKEMVREVILSDRNESFKQEIIGGYLFLLQSVLVHTEDGDDIAHTENGDDIAHTENGDDIDSLLSFILNNQPSARSLTLILHVYKKNRGLVCIVDSERIYHL